MNVTLDLLTDFVGNNQGKRLVNTVGNEDQVGHFISLFFWITNVLFSCKTCTYLILSLWLLLITDTALAIESAALIRSVTCELESGCWLSSTQSWAEHHHVDYLPYMIYFAWNMQSVFQQSFTHKSAYIVTSGNKKHKHFNRF